MTERRRPYRRGRRGHSRPAADRPNAENNPYRDGETMTDSPTDAAPPPVDADDQPSAGPASAGVGDDSPQSNGGPAAPSDASPESRESDEVASSSDQDRQPRDAEAQSGQGGGGQYQGQRNDY